jgi:hypothetical protein
VSAPRIPRQRWLRLRDLAGAWLPVFAFLVILAAAVEVCVLVQDMADALKGAP